MGVKVSGKTVVIGDSRKGIKKRRRRTAPVIPAGIALVLAS
jgi:hypothetical protein